MKTESQGAVPCCPLGPIFLLVPQLMLRVADITGDETIMSDKATLSDTTRTRHPRRFGALGAGQSAGARQG